MKDMYQVLQIKVINLQDDVVRTSGGMVEGMGDSIGRYDNDLDNWFE
jgi:hypothetical protein